MDREIQVFSGVSWLHDRLVKDINERIRWLEENLGKGVPLHEYGNFVGRIKELRRTRDDLVPEAFKDLSGSDDDDDNEEEA
jgi:hypothetical protein